MTTLTRPGARQEWKLHPLHSSTVNTPPEVPDKKEPNDVLYFTQVTGALVRHGHTDTSNVRLTLSFTASTSASSMLRNRICVHGALALTAATAVSAHQQRDGWMEPTTSSAAAAFPYRTGSDRLAEMPFLTRSSQTCSQFHSPGFLTVADGLFLGSPSGSQAAAVASASASAGMLLPSWRWWVRQACQAPGFRRPRAAPSPGRPRRQRCCGCTAARRRSTRLSSWSARRSAAPAARRPTPACSGC